MFNLDSVEKYTFLNDAYSFISERLYWVYLSWLQKVDFVFVLLCIIPPTFSENGRRVEFLLGWLSSNVMGNVNL